LISLYSLDIMVFRHYFWTS